MACVRNASLTDSEILKRLLYVHSYNNVYTAGDPDKYDKRILIDDPNDRIVRWATEQPEEVLKVLTEINEDRLLPRRQNIFHVLASLVNQIKPPSNGNDKKAEAGTGSSEPGSKDEPTPEKTGAPEQGSGTKNQHNDSSDSVDPTDNMDPVSRSRYRIKMEVLNFVKNDEEFFDFVKYCTALREHNGKTKMSTMLRKIVVDFYARKSTTELAECFVSCDSRHAWSHKNLIKLCHIKSPTISAELLNRYVLQGHKKVFPTLQGVPEVQQVTALLDKTHTLRTTEDTALAAVLIQELGATLPQVNSKLYRSEEVWAAVIPNMTTREVLRLLPKFYKMNFLKSGTRVYNKVLEHIKDVNKIRSCDLHPIEVFMYLRHFEKGGKPMDIRLLNYLRRKDLKEDMLERITNRPEPKLAAFSNVVRHCMKESYSNVTPAGKNFLLTIDTKIEDTAVCMHNRTVTAYEAIFSVWQFLKRIEKSVSVAVFGDKKIEVLDFDKVTATNFIDKLKAHSNQFVSPIAPLKWASKHKHKKIDVFVNFIHHDRPELVEHSSEEACIQLDRAMDKYCAEIGSDDVKYVRMFLVGQPPSYSQETRKNVLNICGFDPPVPRVLEAFCKNKFW